MPFLTGQRLTADALNRGVPQMLTDTASSALVASSTAVAVPGISIVFTTVSASALLTLWWTIRADPTGASATALISARPSVVGSGTASSYTATTTNNFALAQWNAGAANDLMTAGNSDQLTLGPAGTYTITLIGTTGTNEQIGIYSSITAMVQDIV